MPRKTQLQQLEAIYESAPIGLCVLDRELRYVRINDYLAAVNGKSPAEHIGRTVREVVPELADRVEPLLRQVLARKDGISGIELTHAGRTLIAQCLPLRGNGNAVVGVNIVAEDITDRKRSELALRKSEERFHALADHITQLAWMGDETGWIFWYNRRWLEYTGTTLDEVQGWGWQKVHHPDYLSAVVENVTRCLATGARWEDTFPLRGRDGTYRWFHSVAVPIRDAHGRITLWVGTNADVTEHRRAAQALLDADRMKNEFLALLGHELRNPIAPILTAAQLLQAGHPTDLKLRKLSDTITRQAMQLAGLVDDLVDVGRITAGKLRLDRKRVALNSIVTQAVETSRALIEERHHTIRVELPDQPIYVDADAGRIIQVVCNLLNNAAKYTADGGHIDISAAEEDGAVLIRVRDDGVGIPQEMLGRVFDRFVQIGASADRRSGLGLGLSLVRAIVEMHGGTVEVRSAGVGAGSEFTVRLLSPRRRETATYAAGATYS